MTLAPWPEEEIRSFASIGTGAKDTKDRVTSGKYPFFVRSQKVERINSWSFDGEAVLTAGDGVGTGKVFHYIDGKFDYHQRVYRISDFRSDVSGRYFFHQFSRNFLARIESLTAKSSVDSVRMETIAGMRIPLPERAEQDRIVQAVDDADDLIATLERLIAKKQAIKQGMMQQLLTGRTRLSGFSSPWKPRRLGDLLTYEQPGRYLVSSADYSDSGIPVLTAGKTFLLGYTTEKNGVFDAVPVIIFDDFTTASKFVDFPFKAKSSAMKMLSARPGVDLRYLYERMQLIEFVAVDHKRRWIAEYSKIEIDVPDQQEQEAIATILDVAQLEIKRLQQRLTKAQLMKTGMMQQLLTGRIRLPVEVSS
ncbi:restriction endonuclease subunit S [Gordonia alkanivorans]|uniref:restriction endonuclease subunit S n=1 Tax=Gordonia alkanivorans TaxID=84096 RepID=UPI000FDEB3D4|nr:restriction endonuclease subunit S [Gordonia alkanivorans]AZZ79745.1 restriction endonuclease subunit S [Gordonia alkanivorans]